MECRSNTINNDELWPSVETVVGIMNGPHIQKMNNSTFRPALEREEGQERPGEEQWGGRRRRGMKDEGKAWGEYLVKNRVLYISFLASLRLQ